MERGGGTVPVHFWNRNNLGLKACGQGRGSLLGLCKRVPHTLALEPWGARFYPAGEVKSEAGERRDPPEDRKAGTPAQLS